MTHRVPKINLWGVKLPGWIYRLLPACTLILLAGSVPALRANLVQESQATGVKLDRPRGVDLAFIDASRNRPSPDPHSDVLSSARPAMRFYSTDDGLPSATVYQISEDSRGRIWVATQDGTAIYNGRSWTSLNLPPGSSSKVVRALAETADGSLWLGTEHAGLWRLRKGIWTCYGAGSGLPHDRVNCLKEKRKADGSSVLWVGTGGGIAKLENECWSIMDTRHGLPSNWVWRFVDLPEPDGSTSYVATTLHGFARLVGDRWEKLPLPHELDNVEVNDIVRLQQPDGRWHTWITVWGRGLYRFDGVSWEAFSPRQGFPSFFPVGLLTTRGPQGKPILWVYTYDAGLAWLVEGRWQSLNAEKGLPANGVYSMLAPRSGRPTLWMGMRDGGLAKLDLSGWYTLNRRTGLPNEEVLSFCESKGTDGSTIPWIGTGRGLTRWEKGRWIVDDERQGLSHARIHALLASSGKTGAPVIWAGTRKGLALGRGGNWKRIPLGPFSKDEQIFSLLETSSAVAGRTLWVGTERGLLKLSGDQGEKVDVEPFLAENSVQAIVEAQGPSGEKEVWVGTRGAGIARYSRRTWKRFLQADGIPNPAVYALHVHRTREGKAWLWAGTFGGGAVRKALDQEDGVWEVFNPQTLPGLKSDVVVGITSGKDGSLLLSTQRGIACLRFQDPLRPERPTAVEHFGPGDGLPSLSCLFGAFRTDSQGRVWVGTPRGAAVFNPSLERDLPALPSLLLDRVVVSGRERDAGELENLSYRENRIVVEYSLPFFLKEEESQFRTQLLGLETEPTAWSSLGRREMTALPAGNYVLRIWARDGFAREIPPADLMILVHPAPWRTWWAYSGYSLALLVLFFFAYRVRVRVLRDRTRILHARVQAATAELVEKNEALKRLNEEKNQFMGIAAHDLKNPLNAVLLASQQIEEGDMEQKEVAHFARMIVKATSQMAELIKNMLDVNRMDTGRLQLEMGSADLSELAMDVYSDWIGHASAKGLLLKIERPDEPLLVWADSLHVRNVIENFVSNAIKFTSPGPPQRNIWIRVKPAEADWAILEIQDEGPGFTEEDKKSVFGRFARLSAKPTGDEPTTGLGLSIVKSLVEVMGGRVDLESEAGKGATFRVLFRIKPA